MSKRICLILGLSAALAAPAGAHSFAVAAHHKLGMRRAERALVLAGKRLTPGAIASRAVHCRRLTSRRIKCWLWQLGWDPFDNVPDPTGVTVYLDFNLRWRPHHRVLAWLPWLPAARYVVRVG